MADDSTIRLARGLKPLVNRVRVDVTAVKKSDGAQAWTRQALTEDRLIQHCNGGPARGVCPVQEGSSVTLVALLDFDSHKGEVSWEQMSATVRRVADVLELAWGMSPVLFRSSGGRGVHLYLLWEEPQDCYSVRAWLREVLEGVGLRSGTGGVVKGEVEIFPRQDSVEKGKFGNQFVLPLSGASAPLAWGEEGALW